MSKEAQVEVESWDDVPETGAEAAIGEMEALESFDGEEESTFGQEEPVEEDSKEEAPEEEPVKEVKEAKEEEEAKEAFDIDSLPDDSKIKVKVDGELQEISLKEYKNGISGEKAIAKRFSEFDRKEKEFKQEIQYINEYVADLGKTMKESSMLEGLYKIAELNKIPPHVVKQRILQEIAPELDRLNTMSDEELALEYRKQDVEYKEKQLESAAKAGSEKQAQTELQKTISEAREAHNISDDEWDSAFSYLDTHLPKDQQVTVGMVQQKVIFDRAESKTETMLSSFDNGKYVENDEVFETLQKVIMDNPDFTDEDISSLLTDAYGTASAQAVEEDVKEAVKVKKAVNKEKPQETKFSAPKNDRGEEVDDWDDLL